MAFQSEAAYKAEYNSLVVGATAMLKRAVQVRVNLGKVGKRGNKYATGPVASATKSACMALGSLKTFKGPFERNAPAARR